MSLEELANTVFPWRRWKSAGEIRDEIDEEIRFHLDERAAALCAEGRSPEEARRQAEAVFGDVHKTTSDCLTVQMGERIMLQKIQWGIIAVLVLVIVFGWYSHAVAVAQQREMAQAYMAQAEQSMEIARQKEELAEQYEATVAELEARANEPQEERKPKWTPMEWQLRFLAKPEDWRHGLATAQALVAEFEPKEALRVLSGIWPHLSDSHKQQSLKAFAFVHGHPETLAVMHLGATDGSLEVQNWALGYLEDYAFQSFANDFEGYRAWFERFGELPLDEVLRVNATEFVTSLHGRTPEELVDVLADFRSVDLRAGENLGLDLAEVFREAGAMQLIEDWMLSEDQGTLDRAFSWAKTLHPGEEWLRSHILPLVEGAQSVDDPLAYRAFSTLGSPENQWAVPSIVGFLERTSPLTVDDTPHGSIWSASGALAEIGDPSVIPSLIGQILANPCYDTVYGIGYFGLGKLTGVSYDESHDGEWWVEWWQKNLARFPPEVRALPIPGADGR